MFVSCHDMVRLISCAAATAVGSSDCPPRVLPLSSQCQQAQRGKAAATVM